ncbi:hypothetical protein CHI95_23130 [Providencia rettgeri]|uniref:Uncharacterized protein n=1 Tax=Providencia rettgeri TaxID=587 RepID=A0A264VMU6_PRORE|nr:hypothetical protein [Providencia rettgeri]ELR5252247.1 hypothetical protein [Providencia rettgeri]OZS72197.1 hypothetical protein CHI95_23130 [Providencia rettgeri]
MIPLVNANEKRAKNHLASAIRFNGSVVTVREWIDALIAQGYKPNAKAVLKGKEASRMQMHRWDNSQQTEHMKKRAQAGTKIEYTMFHDGSGSFYDVKKFAYDYAVSQIGMQSAEPEDRCFIVFAIPQLRRGPEYQRCVAAYKPELAESEQRVLSMLRCDFPPARILWFGVAKTQEQALGMAKEAVA